MVKTLRFFLKSIENIEKYPRFKFHVIPNFQMGKNFKVLQNHLEIFLLKPNVKIFRAKNAFEIY